MRNSEGSQQRDEAHPASGCQTHLHDAMLQAPEPVCQEQAEQAAFRQDGEKAHRQPGQEAIRPQKGLGLFPLMHWGMENSAGHYVDLSSAILGLTLFPVGIFAQCHCREACPVKQLRSLRVLLPRGNRYLSPKMAVPCSADVTQSESLAIFA